MLPYVNMTILSYHHIFHISIWPHHHTIIDHHSINVVSTCSHIHILLHRGITILPYIMMLSWYHLISYACIKGSRNPHTGFWKLRNFLRPSYPLGIWLPSLQPSSPAILQSSSHPKWRRRAPWVVVANSFKRWKWQGHLCQPKPQNLEASGLPVASAGDAKRKQSAFWG